MGRDLTDRFVVFYNDFETRDQPSAKTVAEALAQVQEYDDASHVYHLLPDGRYWPASRTVALLWFEAWLKEHDAEEDTVPSFIDKHLSEKDMNDLIQDAKSWQENPA